MITIEVNVISLNKMLSKKGSFYAIGEFTSSEYGIIRQFMPVEVLNQAIRNKVSPGNPAYLQIEIIKSPDMSLSSKVVGLHTAESLESDREFVRKLNLNLNEIGHSESTDEINECDVDEDMIQ